MRRTRSILASSCRTLLIVRERRPQHAGDDLGGRGLRVEDLIATGVGRLGR